VMVMHEFIHALIRLAWTCYPGGRGGKGSQRRGGDAHGPGGRGRKGSPQHGDDADGDGSGSSLPEGMGERLRRLMEQAVLPASEHLLSDDDEAFEAELFGSRRVRAITEYYKEFLVDVFAIYARSDAALNQKAGHLCKMNFAEVIFLCKEGNLLDEQLSLVQMTSLFVKTSACCVGARTHARRGPYIPTTSPHPHIILPPHACMPLPTHSPLPALRRCASDAHGESMGDDDEGGLDELTFEEFVWLLARVANAKFPNRNGEPFAETWKSFLQLIFVPRFRKLLKAKKQGSGRLTIDGARF